MKLDSETIHLILTAVDDPSTGGTKHEVIGLTADIAICEAWHKPPFPDARFTGAILRDGEWHRTSHYSASADAAMLETLGHKYGGGNSRFGTFAARMLELDKPITP